MSVPLPIKEDATRLIARRNANIHGIATQTWSPMLWFTLGFGFLLLSDGRFVVPLAAWLSWLFLVRFVRSQRVALGCGLAWIATATAFIVGWRGAIPVSDAAFYGMAVGIALVQMLPLLIDRVLVPRLNGFKTSLVLPTAGTVVLFLMSQASPYGTWGVFAYSQYGNLPLSQLLAITGIWGIVFLIFWTASALNWAWAQAFVGSRIRRGVLTVATAIALILIVGGLRLTVTPPASGTVRIASLTVDDEPVRQALRTADFDWRTAEPIPVSLAQTLDRHYDALLALTEREAAAGARLVFWSEASAEIRAQDVNRLLERASEIARRHDAYLILALAVYTEGEALNENKLVTIDAKGEVVAEYLKSKIVPGDSNATGDGKLVFIQTPFGKIAQTICFDLDFPSLIRQAGRAGADILVAPSSDWEAIDPYHTWIATFRGIENGVSIVRQTNAGRSMATDYQGRVLAQTDHFTTSPHVMVANVPVQGARTLYPWLGDGFVWLCGLVLLWLTLLALRFPKGSK